MQDFSFMDDKFQKSQNTWESALGEREAEDPFPESHKVYGSEGQTN